MSLFTKIRGFIFRTSSKMFVNVNSSRFTFANNNLATNETIFSAISLLANSIASAPVSVRVDYKKLKPKEHSLARIFEYGPNSYMTMFQFIRTLETLRNLYGSAYAILEYGYAGEITAMHILKNDFITPVQEEETKELYYEVRCEGGNSYIHSSNIIAVNHISEDGYTATKPLDVLRNTIDYDSEIKSFSINQMQNGLKANMVIKLQSKLNKEDMDLYSNMVSKFQKNGILFVDQGKEFTEIKNTAYIDPKVFDVEKITIERVERVFNIPGKLTGANAEKSEDLMYLKDTILPIARMYEQEFSKKCLTIQARDEGTSVKFSLNGFARGDMKTRGDFYFKAIRSSWFNSNEIRELEDRAPYEGGDTYYISRDMCPIDKIDLLLKGGDKNGR